MRDISKNAANALFSGSSFKQSNTLVENGVLYLYGNQIARYDRQADKLFISLAGWPTLTTCERLNALDGVNINRKQGKVFLNGEEIDYSSWYCVE